MGSRRCFLLLAMAACTSAFGLRGRPALLAARRHRAVRNEAEYDEPEVTEWARSEAASTVREALYAKAAAQIKPPPAARKSILFYSAYAAGFTALLVRTLLKFPLVPPALGSLQWNAAWLVTTVVDYYGAALALCGVILSSETRRDGILWSLGCLLLGTPFCCAYVATRLLRKGSLRLSD